MTGRSDPPRVVVLGGGFAGLGAAQKLRKANADVVLVDRHDYHTFQPLLYQLATGLLETTAVGHSLRDLVERQENTSVHKGTVSAIDLDAREVQFEEIGPLTYDYLVLGLGAEVNFFGTEGAAEHAFRVRFSICSVDEFSEVQRKSKGMYSSLLLGSVIHDRP